MIDVPSVLDVLEFATRVMSVWIAWLSYRRSKKTRKRKAR
jgi:hypothetical protein